MDKELYRIMRDVYSEYTGLQIAEVIAQIRKEIELANTTQEVRSKIIELTTELKLLEKQKCDI